ncbi:protease [Dictyobacter alpinus]|uniref:Protease n=1 Tax=Dictyobacter alpinus TaxID=2014873 RepID=A0A402BCL5_9CHLR|nr:trypsin-like peptidase domain-containing protein [Dictyobacter alpinus]GCE29027.1 protease [Dictyobacter alpinus]
MYTSNTGQPFIEQNSMEGPSRPQFATTPRSYRPYRSPFSGMLVIGAMLLAIIFAGGTMIGWQLAARGGAIDHLQSGSAPYFFSNESDREALREQVVNSVEPSVVQINVNEIGSHSIGSGVVIDRRGYIITNNHVVEGQQGVQVVFSNGQTVTASLIGSAPDDDLAVVHVDPNRTRLAVAAFGDSSQLHVGQDVLAIGNPLGITQTVTNGIISALNRNIATGDDGQILAGTIQTDAPINPGNSGGALVDMHGQLIGIPTLAAMNPESRTPANGVGFAIPSNRVQFIAPQLIQHGKVTHTGRPALQIQVKNLDPAEAQRDGQPIVKGVIVTEVVPNGTGAQAGIKVNDVIVQIDDEEVTDVLSMSDALIKKNVGDTVNIKLYRGGQLQTIKATLGELSATR